MTALYRLVSNPASWVFLGAAAQLTYAARMRNPRSKIWLLGPLSLAGGLLAGLFHHWFGSTGDPDMLLYGAAYGVITAAFFVATQAPARIDEETVLALTTAFWLAFAPAMGARPLLAALAAVPTAAIALLAATRFHPPVAIRTALYVWTLVVLIAFGVRDFSPYAGAAAAGGLGVALYLGSHIALLTHNAASLIVLLPFPMEDMSMKERWKISADHAKRLAESYTPEQISLWRAAVVVAGQAALVIGADRLDWGDAKEVQHGLVWLFLITKIYTSGELPASSLPARLSTTGELHRQKRAARSKKPS